MSFLSLLPPPEHSGEEQAAVAIREREKKGIILKALIDSSEELDVASQEQPVIDSLISQNLSFEDLIPIRQRNFDLEIPQPSVEDIDKTYRRTKKIFDKILLKNLQPENTAVKSTREINDNAYEIQYNTKQSSGSAKSRIFKIVEQAIDPLQPNTIKATKVVAPEEEEAVAPIYHRTDNSDTTKILSKEERDRWNIPAAISSWKNPKGYTIALEKRLAMDARYNPDNLKPHEVSDGFSKLSAALENADRKARKEIKLRAEAKRQLAEEETRKKEEKLLSLAQKAREDREHYKSLRNPSGNKRIRNNSLGDIESQRDFVLKNRKQEIEKEIKKSKMSTADRLRELAYSQGRDISEKVVLGAAKATETSEVHYDSRLFSKGANAQAKRNEEQLYDQPLFAAQSTNSSYRPNLEQINSMIQADGLNSHGASGNSGPIEFTKAANKGSDEGIAQDTEKND